MAHSALIDVVRQQAAAAVAAVWNEARAEAARCRDEAGRSIDHQRDQHASRLRAVAAAAVAAANADADRRARIIRGAARSAVADRMHALAVASLPRFRDASYPARFAALAGELPDRHWTRVTVAGADAPLARAHFAAAVVVDERVVGGLIAEDDSLRVNNTFERRLAAAWPELLPAVMHDVLHLYQRSQPVA